MAASDHSLLDRILEHLTRCLTPETVQGLIILQNDPALHADMSRLADRNRAGELAPDELKEYERAQTALDIVALLQAKAREMLVPTTSGPSSYFRILTPMERQQSEDLDWAAAAPKVLKHEGKFVVVHKKRVVAVGTDSDALIEKATAQEGCSKWALAVMVVPSAELMEMPR